MAVFSLPKHEVNVNNATITPNIPTTTYTYNGTEYVNFHVQVMDGNCIVEIGDEIVMNQPLGFAHEGHIIFARGNGDGSLTQASFDDISVTDYDL